MIRALDNIIEMFIVSKHSTHSIVVTVKGHLHEHTTVVHNGRTNIQPTAFKSVGRIDQSIEEVRRRVRPWCDRVNAPFDYRLPFVHNTLPYHKMPKH